MYCCGGIQLVSNVDAASLPTSIVLLRVNDMPGWVITSLPGWLEVDCTLRYWPPVLVVVYALWTLDVQVRLQPLLWTRVPHRPTCVITIQSSRWSVTRPTQSHCYLIISAFTFQYCCYEAICFWFWHHYQGQVQGINYEGKGVHKCMNLITKGGGAQECSTIQ